MTLSLKFSFLGRFVLGLSIGCLFIGSSAIAEESAPANASTESPAEHLLKQLDSQDEYQRQKAFLQLEALRDTSTAPALRQRADSRDAQTRAWSLRALAAVEGAGAVPLLLERMAGDNDGSVRRAALLGLETLREQDPRIPPAMLAMLNDRNPEVRMSAMDAVSRFGTPEAAEALVARQKVEKYGDAKKVLAMALARVGR